MNQSLGVLKQSRIRKIIRLEMEDPYVDRIFLQLGDHSLFLDSFQLKNIGIEERATRPPIRPPSPPEAPGCGDLDTDTGA